MRFVSDLPSAVTVQEHAWILLSDGTRLCARVWLPDGAESAPVPAVLEYLPHRKNDGTAWQDATRHAYFAGHGFASVRVDVRGTGDSEGIITDEYSETELADGLEALAWIAGQPWCSGRVGMIGYSWGGINALQLAAMRPPELAAIITLYSTDDRFADDCHYKGGIVLGSDMLPWASTMYAYDFRPPDPAVVGERWRDVWLERLERTPPMVEAWLAHQTADGYWRRGSVCTDYSAIEVPVLAVGGWADPYTNTVGRVIEHLPGFRRGIIGPWGHVFPERGVPGPAIGFLQECVRWWERWLAEKDSGVESDPLLRVWMPEWTPPSRTVAEKPGRWLALDAWPPNGPELRYDTRFEPSPALPADLACGLASGPWCPNGLPEQLPDDQAPDDALSLCIDSEPLDERFELLGRVRVRVRLRSERDSTDLVVRLTDVAPDGSSLLVTWHQQRVDVAAGDSVEAELRLDLAAHAFPPGHRVRVAVSGAYWPHAWPRPGGGETFIESVDVVLPSGGAAARESVEPFLEPETAPPLESERMPVRHTHVARLDGDTVVIEIATRHGERFPDGRGHRFERLDRYTVARTDPLSARVECERHAEVFSAGWSTRVETVGAMTADGDDFVVENRVVAYEGDSAVWRSERGARIPRADA